MCNYYKEMTSLVHFHNSEFHGSEIEPQVLASQVLSTVSLLGDTTMGLVRITSWYPNFNGSHFWLVTQRDLQND